MNAYIFSEIIRSGSEFWRSSCCLRCLQARQYSPIPSGLSHFKLQLSQYSRGERACENVLSDQAQRRARLKTCTGWPLALMSQGNRTWPQHWQGVVDTSPHNRSLTVIFGLALSIQYQIIPAEISTTASHSFWQDANIIALYSGRNNYTTTRSWRPRFDFATLCPSVFHLSSPPATLLPDSSQVSVHCSSCCCLAPRTSAS